MLLFKFRRNEIFDELGVLFSALEIKAARHIKDESADKVDEQILHSVIEPDVEVAVNTKALTVDGGVLYIVYGHCAKVPH